MIFVTIGTQLPFPRLLDAMDDIAPQLHETVNAQCGPTEKSWQNITTFEKLAPREFDQMVSQASVLVAHAGIGTILTAKKHGKPLILFPRRHDMGEHRNDHQLATARNVEAVEGVYIAWNNDDLKRLLTQGPLDPAGNTPGPAYDSLLSSLRDFINSA